MEDAIPFSARILSAADAYVAMTSRRPYRDALSPEEALLELRKNAGTQFDPAVVAAVSTVIQRSIGSSDERKAA
ncbi:MAG: hypothetical protein A2Z18_08655 [Armatimonadetes bacterium RBG_16_58_9]|nr:MAG: hypothetical protein A2Z18_08655 [Armatimonadetes bacterium RBG_16_58_9]